MDRKRTRDNEEDFLLIRAKGQYLKVPKDQEHEGISISSGAGNYVKFYVNRDSNVLRCALWFYRQKLKYN